MFVMALLNVGQDPILVPSLYQVCLVATLTSLEVMAVCAPAYEAVKQKLWPRTFVSSQLPSVWPGIASHETQPSPLTPVQCVCVCLQ